MGNGGREGGEEQKKHPIRHAQTGRPGPHTAAHPAKIDRAVEFSAVAVGLVSAAGGVQCVHPTDRLTVDVTRAGGRSCARRPVRD